jgi:methyl-accepting chemotaxis protein
MNTMLSSIYLLVLSLCALVATILLGYNSLSYVTAAIALAAAVVIFLEYTKVQKDIEFIEQANQKFIRLINGEINSLQINDDDFSSDCMGKIKHEFQKTIDAFMQKEMDNLGIYGDIMICCEKVSDGYLDERITYVTQNPQLKYISKTLNDMFQKVDGIITNILNIFESYSQKDFDTHLKGYMHKGGMASLIQGVNTLGNQLGTVRQNNINYAKLLTEQALRLQNIVSQLQNSSNEQAASLEQTAAATTQISSSISGVNEKIDAMQQSVSHIQNALAQGKLQATDTGNFIQDVTKANLDIEEATKNLDEIAIQTNILSLNASVEAASAGEHGRGFSIVAQEVGTLASRSSQVVNNVKALVKKSIDAAKSGEQKIAMMIDTLEEITGKTNVSRKNSQEVSTITAEQNNAIFQINEALQMLEKLSNKNLELAQNTAEVSGEVTTLSTTLRNSI